MIRALMAEDRDVRPRSADQVLRLLADLPAAPAWSCTVAADLIECRRTSRDRLHIVQWRTHSPRRHERSAYSEPIGAGRSKRLGRSDGEVPRRDAVAGLEAFFASQL